MTMKGYRTYATTRQSSSEDKKLSFKAWRILLGRWIGAIYAILARHGAESRVSQTSKAMSDNVGGVSRMQLWMEQVARTKLAVWSGNKGYGPACKSESDVCYRRLCSQPDKLLAIPQGSQS